MGNSSSSHLQTGWAFRIATVAGIPIRIHFTFVLILVYVGSLSSGQGHALLGAVAGLVAMFVCVVLHELGHALVARRFGVETLEIVLYPIGGVARLKSLPSGKAELLIAIAGPAVNLAIAMLLFPVMLFLGPAVLPEDVFDLQGPAGLPGAMFVVNVTLLLFNLIPAFPMDGGRILRSTLTLLGMPEDRATNIAAGIGQAIAVVFAIVGLFTQPFLVLIALVVFLGAGQEAAFVQRRLIVRGRSAREAMMTRFDTLAPQDSLRRAAEMLLDSHQQDFPVVDAWGRVAGVLSRSAILEGLAKPEPGGAVLEIMDRNIHAVAPGSSMEEVLRCFQESGGKPVLVMDGDSLVGMLTLDKLAEFIEVARRSPAPVVGRG